MGFAGYFLIVADFIRWARENGVPVGPGRGSGAGSLVAYALGITDLDPIEHDLLFERFLNPERVSMPDFDVDFCMEGRDRVIEYVAQQVRPRARLADHHLRHHGGQGGGARRRPRARHDYGYVDKIAKLIPFEIGITLDKALEQGEGAEAPVRERRRRCANLIDLARIARGPGAQRRHACRRRGHRAVGAHRLHAAVLRRGRQQRRSRSSTRTTSRPRAWSSSTSWACARSPSSTGRCATSTRARAARRAAAR